MLNLCESLGKLLCCADKKTADYITHPFSPRSQSVWSRWQMRDACLRMCSLMTWDGGWKSDYRKAVIEFWKTATREISQYEVSCTKTVILSLMLVDIVSATQPMNFKQNQLFRYKVTHACAFVPNRNLWCWKLKHLQKGRKKSSFSSVHLNQAT